MRRPRNYRDSRSVPALKLFAHEREEKVCVTFERKVHHIVIVIAERAVKVG